MFDDTQRFQIARRFDFADQVAALRFVQHLAELRETLGGDYEIDLAGTSLRVRIAAAPLQGGEQRHPDAPARMPLFRVGRS